MAYHLGYIREMVIQEVVKFSPLIARKLFMKKVIPFDQETDIVKFYFFYGGGLEFYHNIVYKKR